MLIKILFCFIIVFYVELFNNLCSAQSRPGRYNVLFIIADDMNERCDFLGHPEVKTPNLDKLASHGVVFTNAYAQFPLCSPSRTSLITGWRPDSTHVLNNHISPRSEIGNAKKMMPEYFHDFGYRTERYGKILHSQFQKECLWDYSAPEPDLPDDDDHADSGINKEGNWWITTPGTTYPGEENDEKLINNLANALSTQMSVPCFRALGIKRTHAPFSPDINSWNRYCSSVPQDSLYVNPNEETGDLTGNTSKSIKLPDTPIDDLNDIPAIATVESEIYQLPNDEWQKSIHAYYAEVSEMDQQLGKIIDELDEKNLWSNTIVIFTSDHGQHLGEHEGIWFKNDLFNESLHVPIIICAPGAQPGTSDKLIELVDIYKTLVDLCGLPRPADIQGTSLVPLLINKNMEWKSAVFSQVERRRPYACRAVYTNQYHYNWWNKSFELYDRVNDPFEYTNLAIKPAYADTLTKLESILYKGAEGALPPVKDSVMYFSDADGDGYGNIQKYRFGDTVQPKQYVKNFIDLNDNDASIYPEAPEICDGKDNDGDGIADIKTIVLLTSDTQYLCSNSSVDLQVKNVDGYHYEWYKNGLKLGDTAPNYLATDEGHYTVHQYTNSGCQDSAVMYVKYNIPNAVITVSADTNICSNTVILTASNGINYLYQWYRDTTAIPWQGQSQEYIPIASGIYSVRITNEYGCNEISKPLAVIDKCPSDTGDNSIISVYPNPATNELNIKYLSTDNEKIQLIMVSPSGKNVRVLSYDVLNGNNTLKADIKKLLPGMYFIKIITGKKISFGKFIVGR